MCELTSRERIGRMCEHAEADRNHPQLQQELRLLFDECRRRDAHAVAYTYAEQVDKGQGRVQTRRCWMTTDVKWLPGGDAWQNLSSFACVESVRQIGEKVEIDRRYFISSVEKCDAAEDFSRLSRMALNLLKAGPPAARSIRARRLLAGWNHDYLLSLLTHEPDAAN